MGQSRYQLLLYLSIVIILLKEKESWKRITFGWYGIACLIGLMNPIIVKITSIIWGESVAYYCRQISLIPIFIVIAYGMVLALHKIRAKNKAIIVILVVLFMCINGQNIYEENWYTKAENFNKIPNEVIEIADFFQNKGSSIRIAAPTTISPYLRQYYNIVQLQGRYVDDGNMEADLQNATPDADAVMQYAGKIECDYIVVKGNNDIKNIYEEAGYVECFTTENYLIYKVEGVERWKGIYDDKNLMVKEIFLDENNNVTSSTKGYAIVKYTYDLEGRVLYEHYFDSKEQKIALYSGEYGVSYKYDENGHKIQIAYLDENDKLLKTTNGYAIVKYVYNETGTKDGEYYYDENEKPTPAITGQYGQTYEYYEDGKLYERVYLDENGERFTTDAGYASIRFKYTEAGDKRYEQYYDENLNPVAVSTGQYGALNEYEEGNISQTTYLDENGKPMVSEDGCAIVRYTYDKNGSKNSEHYFDTENKPISLALGQYGTIYEYHNDKLIEKTYLDETDHIFETKLGYASVEYIYDSNYNKVGEKYYDLKGDEVKLDE